MLIQDKDVIVEIQVMIEEIPIEPRLENKVNQVRKKLKTGCELKMTA